MNAKSPDTQKHTPGPWTLSRNLGIASANGREILFPGHVSRGVDHPEREANARLIASAPELLKALKALYDIHIELDDAYAASGDISKASPELLAARAAITKAEGSEVPRV